MQNLRRVAVPAYLVAALLILIPLLDTSLSTLPARAGEVSWRFGAAGLFSRALMIPFVGLLIAHTIAVALEQRRVLRALSMLEVLLAVTLLGGVALFVLDAVQMRTQVRPEAQTAFDVATLVALTKYGLGILLALAFAVSGWKAAGGARATTKKSARASEQTELIVRQARA